MNRLKSFLKWGALSLCVLLVILAAAWAISKMMYPTQAQREAIAEMESLPEYGGDNAFALLWSLGYDVPDAELEQVLEEDVQRFSETPLVPDPEEEAVYTGFDSVKTDYASLSPSSEDRGMFCGDRDESCLEKVRQDLDAYQAMIERNRRLLDRVSRLDEFEYLRSPFPPRMNAPIPAYQPASYLRTRHAVEFASGNEREAIASVCREIQTWRRLSANSELMIDRIYGIANATKHNGALLANMLSEWPVDQPLPAPCDSALAPPELADVSLCNAVHGEFARVAFSVRTLDQYNSGLLDRLLMPVFIDAEASAGLSAEHFQRYCDASTDAALLADRQPARATQSSVARFECVGNLYGCILSAIAEPGYSQYESRTLDHGAHLRVLGTLAWMRQNAGVGRTPKALLEDRPDALKSPERNIVFGPEGRTLQVPLYEPEFTGDGRERVHVHWSIPLPPALYEKAGG
ncbi:MAG: hypothetical protein U5L08_10155 [Xanthomonadales bacterium]|nr:hypothetical protein [Xanthomonadales bacterium]